MKYFELTGYSKEQNKKDLTWEEAKNLPIYVQTPTGQLWQGNKKIPLEAFNTPCYVAGVNRRPITLYFFEKATLWNMKGVKLHLMQKFFAAAKEAYDLASDDKWVFITPDWKVYNMKGDQVKINDLKYMTTDSPSYYDFKLFSDYGHDLRIIGKFTESNFYAVSSRNLLSPATVEILKEVGFDMTTSMKPAWQICSGSSFFDIPEDSYSTQWFFENLIHPNRVARRRKQNSQISHDYEYYRNLMGKNDFLVFEEEGQVYIAQKSSVGNNLYKITVLYLKMPGRKALSCVCYSDKGSVKLTRTDGIIELARSAAWRDTYKDTCNVVLDQLLSKKQLLEETEVFRNLIPELEKAKSFIKSFKFTSDVDSQNYGSDPIFKIYKDLSYVLTPGGQKDRVFEETVKQNGFGKGLNAYDFLRVTGDKYTFNPDFKQKTPYGQVGLTKSAYYGLRKLIDAGFSIDLNAIIVGFTENNDYIDRWRHPVSKQQYLADRLKFCAYLTPDFLDLLKNTVSVPRKSYDLYYGSPSIESWSTMLRLAGKNSSSPLSKKVAAVTRTLKKFRETSKSPKERDTAFELFSSYPGILKDYYRQIDELAPLGIDWPQRYEEFHVKNILWFLGTIRGYDDLVNRAKNAIPNASFVQRIKILHDLQNQISALNRMEIEKAALQQMDKEYAPWKEQLKKALSWKGQNLGIFIPESLAELTVEGKILHHCVGSYKKDVAQRKEGILFLRKLSCPGMPYYTLDVVKEPSGKYQVRQCHGNCNSNPTPEVVEALKKWAADTGKVDESSIKDDYRALCCL